MAEPVELVATVADPRCGLLVQLECNPCTCGDDMAVIGPGTETHAARLDCSACGKFRIWLPREIFSFVIACIDAAGMPTDPIVYRDRTITIGDKAMNAPERGFQSKPNTGALFRNEQKENSEDRDYSGSINIDGTEYWVSGWINQSKKTGKKYLSLSLKPKDEAARTAARPKPDFNDEVPFN
jgi:hypothetical protein